MSQRHDFEKNYAIIIGINNYAKKPLRAARNDAEKLAQILSSSERLNDEQYKVLLLTDEEATHSNLTEILEGLKLGKLILPDKTVELKERNRLLIYFSGHGVASSVEHSQKIRNENERNKILQKQFLLCQDEKPLALNYLFDTIKSLSCRHLMLILDCCFAGQAIYNTGLDNINVFRTASFEDDLTIKYERQYNLMFSRPAWTAITSSGSEEALDSTNSNQTYSYFAQALFKALNCNAARKSDLNDDDIITDNEIFTYLKNDKFVNDYQNPQKFNLTFTGKKQSGQYFFLMPDFEPTNLEEIKDIDSPYKGLFSYEEKDALIFKGRDRLVEDLFNRVYKEKHKLTVVTGASGSGKSSLVKAGLITKINKANKSAQSNNEKWKISEPIRPGKSPLLVLIKTFQLLHGSEETNISDILLFLENDIKLMSNDQNLQQKIEVVFNELSNQLIQQVSNNQNLLLIIDQFEELVTLCQPLEREYFLKLLTQMLNKLKNFQVVLTVRSDFEIYFRGASTSSNSSSTNDINISQYWNKEARLVVSEMKFDELKEAIEKPARLFGVDFESDQLVNDIIDDVRGMPGALPILSFTLSELYQKYLSDGTRDNHTLTKKDYEDLGRVVGSLTKRADQEYNHLFKENPAYGNIVQKVMLRMISLQGGELARRQVLRSELVYPSQDENEHVETVIKRFSEARLIVEGSNFEGNSYVEPAHDALVRMWDQLLTWKMKQEENLLLRQRLTPGVNDWQIAKRLESYLWNTNPYLALLENVVINSEDSWLNQLETDFIKRSIRKKEEEYINEKKQTINLFSRASQAYFASNQDLEALIEAIQGAKEFQKLRYKLQQLQEKNILEDEAAICKDIELQSQMLQTLRKVFYSAKERNRIELPQDFKKMFFASDGTLLIATAGNDSIVLQDLKGEKLPKVFSGHKGEVTLDVNQDGCLLAAIDEQGTIRLWNLKGKQEEAPKLVTSIPQSSYSDIYDRGIGFSPDGKQLVAYVDGLNKNDNVEATVFLWNLLESEPKLLKTSQKVLSGISFNPKNQLIVATQSDDTLFLSDFVSGKKLAKFTDFYGSLFGNLLNNFVFSPDSQYLVAYYGADMSSAYFGSLDDKSWSDFKPINRASSIIFDASGNLIIGQEGDGIIGVYDPSLIEDSFSNGLQFDIKGHQGSIREVISRSNGRHFASQGSDNTIRLWDVGQKTVAELRQIPNLISISISPNGEQLAVVQSDGTVRLLDLNANELKRFGDIQGKIIQLIFSPDGRQLAAVGKDITISLLDMNGKELYKSPSFKKTISQLIFRPDGQQLAVVENNGTIHLLNLNNKTWGTLSDKVSPNDNFEGTSRIAFSSDGRLLVANSPSTEYCPQEQGNIFLSELGAGKRKELVKFKGAINSFNSIGLNTQGNLLASAYSDDIYVWDISGKLLTTFKHRHKGKVNTISFSADGSLLVTLSSGTAKLWLLGGLNELVQQGCVWLRDYIAISA